MELFCGLLEMLLRFFIKLYVKKVEMGWYDSKIVGDFYYLKYELYFEDESGRLMKFFVQINFVDMFGLFDFLDVGIFQFYILVSDDVYGLNFDDGCV